MTDHQAWKTLSRTAILRHSKYLTVEDHVVQLPNGTTINNWPWLAMPEYVNVVLETAEKVFLCFRQTKYAAQGVTLAPIGGYCEPGEEPLTTARREVLEETGYQAGTFLHLGSFAADGNRGGGIGHLFLARDARPVAERVRDDLEEQEFVFLSRAELRRALLAGEFKVLGWTAAIALALIATENNDL
ncbi:MAG TPA: NUDIX hydrolase [Bacteroidota bacterium]